MTPDTMRLVLSFKKMIFLKDTLHFLKGYTMNEFMNRNSDYVLSLVLAIIIAIEVLTLVRMNDAHTENMAAQGYEQKALEGTARTVWVKTDEKH